MTRLGHSEDQRWPQVLLPARPTTADLSDPGVRFSHLGSGSRQGTTVLLVRPGVRVWVNGRMLLEGLWLLEDGDQVVSGGMHLGC
jgi:hypothetical protein